VKNSNSSRISANAVVSHVADFVSVHSALTYAWYSIGTQCISAVALAVERGESVDTDVGTAAVVHQTFIDIFANLADLK